jgi:hypothetical protein
MSVVVCLIIIFISLNHKTLEMKNLSITLLSLLFVFSCSQDPKIKTYTEENVKDDLMLFSDSDKELIQGYVIRQTMMNEMSGMFGVTESDKVDLKSLTYGDMISSQSMFLLEQVRKDSLQKIEDQK